MSPYTVQARVRALKAFSSWLFKEGYTSDNILASIKLPKAPVKIVDTLSPDEIEALIDSQNPLTFLGSRNIAILVTLLDTGLRCSELSNLLFENTHIEEGYLKVIGKGSKERLVPIGALTQKVLWRYVFHFRPQPINGANDYLFLTSDGEKLEYNAIRLLLKRWGKKAYVPRLHAHLCRHTYATNYLCHGCGDVFRLQHILGHNTLEMVRRYVHYASSQSLMSGKISSPLDQMGIRKLQGYKIDQMLREKRGRKRFEEGKLGRPRISVDYAIVLRLRDVENLGWSRMAEAYRERTRRYISRDTIKRRYFEAKARESTAMKRSD